MLALSSADPSVAPLHSAILSGEAGATEGPGLPTAVASLPTAGPELSTGEPGVPIEEASPSKAAPLVRSSGVVLMARLAGLAGDTLPPCRTTFTCYI